jgi:hypothetical protein
MEGCAGDVVGWGGLGDKKGGGEMDGREGIPELEIEESLKPFPNR